MSQDVATITVFSNVNNPLLRSNFPQNYSILINIGLHRTPTIFIRNTHNMAGCDVSESHTFLVWLCDACHAWYGWIVGKDSWEQQY